MNEHLLRVQPARWKVFQCLLLEGENSGPKAKRDVTEFLISDDKFSSFVKRHQNLPFMIPEDNTTMKDSYLLLDEKLRFLDCSQGKKIPSQSILDVGVEEAFKQSGFNKDLFDARGGNFDWKKENLLK